MAEYNYNTKKLVFGALVLEVILTVISIFIVLSYKRLLSGLRLENPEWIIALLALPIITLAFIFTIVKKNRGLKKFGDTKLLSGFAQPISGVKTYWKYACLRLGFWFLVLAIINPKIGSKLNEAKTEGIEIVFCLDVSNSMLAEDLKPNRLSRAKRVIEKTIDQLHGDQIGIIVFAGDAYVQLPVTSDYSAAKLFLNTVTTDIVPVQGTAIGKALDLAFQSFDLESPAAKTIVVITDGENHEDDAVHSAKYAFDNGVIVNIIGMGTTAGAPIPVSKNNFKKGKEGSVVISKLNPELISEVADAGGGLGIYANNNNNGTSLLIDSFSKLQKAELDAKTFTDFEDRFQWFLLPALLLFGIELIMSNRSKRKTRGYEANI